jgi:rRNA maturation endonuclease Nob1
MWELIRERTALSEEDLERKMLEVDMRDGRADGKIDLQILTCDACGQKTNSKRSVCVMCGAPVKRATQFDV